MHVLPSFVAIFQLHSVVWCHQPVCSYKQTKCFRKVCQIQNEKHERIHSLNDTVRHHRQARRIADKQLTAVQRGGCRPRRETPTDGCGLFRDPLEVFGPGLSTKVILNLCEMHLMVQADMLAGLKFTRRGTKTCTDVCTRYNKSMRLNGPVTVMLIQGFCNYAGIGTKLTESDLETTCTCLYQVRCNSRTSVVIYTFEANCMGYVKVLKTETKDSQRIT